MKIDPDSIHIHIRRALNPNVHCDRYLQHLEYRDPCEFLNSSDRNPSVEYSIHETKYADVKDRRDPMEDF